MVMHLKFGIWTFYVQLKLSCMQYSAIKKPTYPNTQSPKNRILIDLISVFTRRFLTWTIDHSLKKPICFDKINSHCVLRMAEHPHTFQIQHGRSHCLLLIRNVSSTFVSIAYKLIGFICINFNN